MAGLPHPGRSGPAPILQGWNASSRRSCSSTSSARRSSSRARIPEVVRSRLTRFFDQVTHCITTHGGIVQKFGGDAVMAAFGVPFAHEDDPERAVRAALGIVDAVGKLGLEVRIGIETGEILSDETETTFATGLAINAAARLQQAAQPGEIMLGPTVERLTRRIVVTTPLGAQEARGFPDGVEAWRVVSVADDVGRRLVVSVPLVGREEEIELLHNTFARVVRDSRVHLVTVFGAPGVGKSRLAREFIDGVERSTILTGRCLPYGEGVTYWAVAEMVKVAAGITDDDTVEAANEKLRNCCGDEAVADLLGAGVGRARRGRCGEQSHPRSPGRRRRGRRSSPTCSRSCSSSRTSIWPRSRCST